LIRHLDDLPADLRGGAVSVGNFDGVHLGHARIIHRLIQSARAHGGPAVAFTFDPHPAVVLRPDRVPPPLTTTERKADLLGRLGVDAVVAYPTNREFLEFSARDFFDRILVNALGARAVVEGPNFFFGRDRRGNVDVLKQFCVEASIDFEVVEPYDLDGRIISSSRTRRCLAEGRVEEVAAMLTEPYRVHGMVVHGAGRGASLGFPTANVDMVPTLLPREGIYAGRGYVEGQPVPAAISLGPNPTFNEGKLKLEVFLLDFEGDLYGQLVEVDFLARLRDVMRYHSVDELLAQMHRDVEATRQIVKHAISQGVSS
jgi:riboflavin kinase/FMN adenylyltransferase